MGQDLPQGGCLNGLGRYLKIWIQNQHEKSQGQLSLALDTPLPPHVQAFLQHVWILRAF